MLRTINVSRRFADWQNAARAAGWAGIYALAYAAATAFAPVAQEITSVSSRIDGDSVRIGIAVSSKIPVPQSAYSIGQDKISLLVIEFPGVGVAGGFSAAFQRPVMHAQIAVDKSGGHPTTRVMLYLEEDARYGVSGDGDTIRIAIARPATSPQDCRLTSATIEQADDSRTQCLLQFDCDPTDYRVFRTEDRKGLVAWLPGVRNAGAVMPDAFAGCIVGAELMSVEDVDVYTKLYLKTKERIDAQVIVENRRMAVSIEKNNEETVKKAGNDAIAADKTGTAVSRPSSTTATGPAAESAPNNKKIKKIAIIGGGGAVVLAGVIIAVAAGGGKDDGGAPPADDGAGANGDVPDIDVPLPQVMGP